jgi:hypothetical protein
MSRTISAEGGAKRRGRRIPRSGVRQIVAGHFVAVIGSFHVKSEEGFCRRDEIRRRRSVAVVEKSTSSPALNGRAEIYRESRTLSTWQIVAGKFRPKKKRRGQGNKKLCKSFQFVGGGRIKL